MTAPNLCMLLRKHLGSAKILDISQPGLERIIRIKTEHLDEIGDLSVKNLVIELMGKYSNIILLDDEEKVRNYLKKYNITKEELEKDYDEIVNQKVLKDWCSIYDSKYSPSNYGEVKVETQWENW